MQKNVFDVYDIVECIFKNLPYNHVSILRHINSVCNHVGKDMCPKKWKDEIESKAYELLIDVENTPYSILNWQPIHLKFQKMCVNVVGIYQLILVKDFEFLQRFIIQCLDFQFFFDQIYLAEHLCLSFQPWWFKFKEDFKKYCSIDNFNNFNDMELRQITQLKGHNVININKIKKLLRRPKSYKLNY